MKTVLESFGLLLWGILKRLYYLIPSLLLDPFDFVERWFKLMYKPPEWLFWVLLAGGLFIATFLAYHELRLRMETKLRPTKQKAVLGDFLQEGEVILKKISQLKADDAIALAEDWIKRTHEYLKKELPSHASIFLSDTGLERVTHLVPRMKNRLTRITQILGLS
jgi:hypothetical protein